MPKMKGFTPAQQESILRQAKDFWEKADNTMGSFFDLVNEMERLTRVLLPSELESRYRQFQDRSALVPSDIHDIMNSHRANIRKALFKKKPYYRLAHPDKPGFRDDRITKAEQILQGVDDMANDGRGFPSQAMKVIDQAMYAGLSASFLKISTVTDRVVRRNPMDNSIITDENGDPVFDEKKIGMFPESIDVDIRRCRIDPSAAQFKNVRIVGYHGLENFSELRKRNKDERSHYKFNEEELWKTDLQRDKYFQWVTDEGNKVDKAYPNDTFGDKLIEVWSIRGLFRVSERNGVPQYQDLVVEVGNRDILLAVKKNDLPVSGWELFDFAMVSDSSTRMFQMGLVEPARDTFIEMFIKANQSLDSANRNVYRNWVADSAAAEDLPEYLDATAENIYRVDVMASGLRGVRDAIQPLVGPELGQDTFLHSQVLGNKLQRTMRSSDYLEGNNPESSETATGVVQLVSGGENLTDELIDNLTDTFLRPQARKKLKLWNFINAHKEESIRTPEGRVLTITPREIDIPFLVSVETNIGATHPTLARRMVEIFPVIANDPHYDPREVRRTMNEILDLPNKEKLMPPDDYLHIQIDRENLALGEGVQQPVHELDNHSLHVEVHSQYLEYILELPPEEQPDVQLIADHIEEHQAHLEAFNQALGNTKELGGNTGNLSQPDSAAATRQKPSPTGNFLPQAGRA